ncbi:phospholipase D regulator [Aspergillus undulatus]|uniref:phospholipase D regulator n=1 Tax=Aspergillus undulatus TaxID=1810928 RepID=UPI003CCE1543
MAQDAREIRVQPPDSSLPNDLSEKPVAEWSSPINHQPSGQGGDNHPMDGLRTGSTAQSCGLSPVLADAVTEDSVTSQAWGRKLRTLPAWIRSLEYQEDDDIEANATSRLLPSRPSDAFVAQHNHSPYSTSKQGPSYHSRGGSLEENPADRESRWKSFSKTIAYPREPGREEKLVTPDWLDENHGDYSQPWRGQVEPDENTDDPLKKKRRREIWFKRFHNTLLQSPIVPLIIRLTVWAFSLTALALGASIQRMTDDGFPRPQGPSALMAIIVDAVALVYLVYITWDEYTSKPLGLRSPAAKARLVLLDIFFIVFDSANLSIAFESLSSAEGACTVAEINQTVIPRNDQICHRQIALASVLLIALIAWLITFSISVLRLVERVSTK